MKSDIDSGNENVADGHVNVFSCIQLLECAVQEMKLTNGKVVRSNDDEPSKTNDYQYLQPELKNKNKISNVKHIDKWKHSDLPVIIDFEWNLPIPALGSHETLLSLFEKFLTDDILQFIGNETVRYAQKKD